MTLFAKEVRVLWAERITAKTRTEPGAPEPLERDQPKAKRKRAPKKPRDPSKVKYFQYQGSAATVSPKKQWLLLSTTHRRTSTSTVDHTSPLPPSDSGYGSLPLPTTRRRSSTSTVDHTSPLPPSDSGYGSLPQTPNDTKIHTSSPQVVDKQDPSPDNAALLRCPPRVKTGPTVFIAVELLKLLWYLGGAKVPEFLLLDVKCQYLSFNRAGEIQKEGKFELIPVLHDVNFTSAIQYLLYEGLITSDPPCCCYTVSPESVIEGYMSASEVRQLKVQASKLVCHTFPPQAIRPAE
jgi:hypothetical protein